MYTDSLKIKEEELNPDLPLGSYQEKKTEVCYEEIGCFSKIDGPFSFSSLHPETPEQIKTRFSLFTRHNLDTPIGLSYLDKSTLSTEWLDPTRPLAVISHGLNENDKKNWITSIKNDFLKKDYYGAVLVLDWSKGAVLPFYGQSMVNCELVGRQLAYILELLHQRRGLRMDTVHLLGYSLGAHLSGFAGKTLRDKAGLRVGRITGFDPAGPTFEEKDHRVHLSSQDAEFVDIIHSSAGSNLLLGDLGIVKPIGHVDFYPNGGKSQPGCGFFDIACSHRRASELFIESLSSTNCDFVGYPCEGGFQMFQKGQCRECGDGKCAIMGLRSIESAARGSLYLQTRKEAPYCVTSAK